MRLSAFVLIGGAVAAPAAAGTVTVTIPRLNVAEYHRPYVAVWLDPVGGGAPRTLALWYDVKKAGNEPGTKWLSELRAWWRKGGRGLAMPADGISGATRAPGRYSIPLPATLKPGNYVLNVEAARETGGRAGKSELGAIALSPR
jgi:hypothetical protein